MLPMLILALKQYFIEYNFIECNSIKNNFVKFNFVEFISVECNSIEYINGNINIKEINIKNGTYYFFNDMIIITNFDPKLLKIEKKLHKNLLHWIYHYKRF